MANCVFLGGSCSEEMKQRIKDMAEKPIKENSADKFYTGSESDFERFATEAIKELRDDYPHIRHYEVLYRRPAASDEQIFVFFASMLTSKQFSRLPTRIVPDGIDGLSKEAAAERRREYMLRIADFVVSCGEVSECGGKKVINLGQE